MSNDESLILKYRPQEWEDVIGQDTVVAALKNLVEARSSHAFLFVGSSGTGKTTLARIAAHNLGANDSDILEVDAAKYTGIESMRDITDGIGYKPFGSDIRVVILNECHRISAQAWDSLLMSVEEPPAHLFWFFTTTNPSKLPTAIVTRCSKLEFKAVQWQTILRDLLVPVADAEQMDVDEKILGLCAREANGSPRQALSNLAVVVSVKDPDEAAKLLRSVAENAEAVELARALVNGTTWEKATEIVNKLREEDPEGIRQVVRAYATSARLGAKTQKAALMTAAILDAFSRPCYSSDGITPIILAVDRILLLK